MEQEQEIQWREAQKISINVDLVSAAQLHLRFLATVDRNRWLYQPPALDTAIYRYKALWLPLLAKHSQAPLFEGPLVVPLDCEWVWHCHRLNPVRYKTDCEEFYGKILDNRNVVSSIQGASKRDTEHVWKQLYPDEPYELDSTTALAYQLSENDSSLETCNKYDLISAVQRQAPFTHQVSRPHLNNELYLEGAVARYKGFLYLIKRNKERSIRSFTVPTYDIDLIWHTHQLHPVSYCNDLVEIMGKVLEHDDTDSDRTKGKKLDAGFSGTTNNWEETYGSRYWRAGAMYRGSAPSPLQTTPYPFTSLSKKVINSDESKKIIDLEQQKVIEVMLEFVSVKNLPEGNKGSLSVSFSKTEPDTIFDAKKRLTILSESGVKQVACFHCQPTGDLLFELMIHSSSSNPLTKSVKTLGSGSISFEDLLLPKAGLIMERWLDLMPPSNIKSSNPISLRVSISVTLPTSAPYVLHMVRSRSLSKSSCFFPLSGKVQSARNWTRVTDEDGNEVISVRMREIKKSKGEISGTLRKEVIGILKSGETCTLADIMGTHWSFCSSQWSLQLPNSTDNNGLILELTGHHAVRFYSGRRLEYEANHCKKWGKEQDFITAVEFSAEDPYGKAVALLDLNSGIIKVKEKWLLLPATVLAFILGEIVRKNRYDAVLSTVKSIQENENPVEEIKSVNNEVGAKGMESDLSDAKQNAVIVTKGGGCGGCGGGGGGFGSTITSGACGGCGAGGCGSMTKDRGVSNGSSGGCGGCSAGGCGGCGGCGAGGCGSMNNDKGVSNGSSGGCGGCGAGGCGSMTNGRGDSNGSSGGCGGCGAGGCGSMAKSGTTGDASVTSV